MKTRVLLPLKYLFWVLKVILIYLYKIMFTKSNTVVEPLYFYVYRLLYLYLVPRSIDYLSLRIPYLLL